MESTRELDQIRGDIEKLQNTVASNKTNIVVLESISTQQYNQLIKLLATVQKDLDLMKESVDSLNHLASEGKTSLRTLVWAGGAIASLTAFILLLYDYIPKQ